MIVRNTKRICIADARVKLDDTLKRVASGIQQVLPLGFNIEWKNVLNPDPNDPNYNPDATWGRFVVITPEPEFDDEPGFE